MTKDTRRTETTMHYNVLINILRMLLRVQFDSLSRHISQGLSISQAHWHFSIIFPGSENLLGFYFGNFRSGHGLFDFLALITGRSNESRSHVPQTLTISSWR